MEDWGSQPIIEAEVVESRTESLSHVHAWRWQDSEDGGYTYCEVCNLEIPKDSEIAQAEILRRLAALEAATNSQSATLNWLAENTAGLFATIAQMNAAGGPMAMLGMLKGGN